MHSQTAQNVFYIMVAAKIVLIQTFSGEDQFYNRLETW